MEAALWIIAIVLIIANLPILLVVGMYAVGFGLLLALLVGAIALLVNYPMQTLIVCLVLWGAATLADDKTV